MTHFVAGLLLASPEDLSPRMRRWLDRHLSGCARCRTIAERHQAMREALAPVRESAPPALDFDRIERRIRQDAKRAPAANGFPRALVLAAAAALAAIVFWSTRGDGPRPARTAPPGMEEPTLAERDLATGIVTLVQGSVFATTRLSQTERRVVARMRLGEGSRIVTATNAAIVVQTSPSTGFRLGERARAVVTTLRDRQLELSLQHGEVGSSVAPLGPGDRFAIRVDSLVVHVRGTRFSVARGDEEVSVEVLEGTVEVERYEESVSLHAPARAVFRTGEALATAARSAPEAPADALGAAALNLRDEWPHDLVSLRVPGDRGSGGDVRVDGVPMGTTPLLVLREPGPATVELLHGGELTRFEVDVNGQNVEPGAPVEAAPTPAPPAVGRLESAAIRRVIQSHTADVRRCYERPLKRTPNLLARVEMRFTVGSDGHVTDARAQRAGAATEIVGCLETAVKSWTFDRPQGGPVTVVYPLSFAPAGSRQEE